ncbi:TfdA family taurine catabolism dioxygenase TauD [Xylariales sp. AK1849]|nr:TfdA family taurine catabolism dioxygenase TauD [Xylariales sp. AK1849]
MEYTGTGPVVSPQLARDAQPPLWNTCYVGSDESLGLPTGFPSCLNEELAWTGAHFKHDADYIYHLTDAEIAEINSALSGFKALELDGDLVDRDNFPLPTLGPKLVDIGHVLHNGRGFYVIRGINPKNYSVEDLMMVWLGTQTYIANQRGCQDHKGNMLVHVVADGTSNEKIGHHRHSTSAISFHNEEAGDIAAWLTRSTADSGGRCIIASAYNVYNVLAAHRPDVIRTLAKADWPFCFPRFQCRPVVFHQDSRMIMNFGRAPLLGNTTHPRPQHLPKCNDRQREALDLVEAIAQATQLEIQTQAGDMHFINNLAVLHRRESFVDGQAAQNKRHLVRMRLRSSQLGWDIPSELRREWSDAFEKDSVKTWHLEPMPGDAFPLRKYTN